MAALARIAKMLPSGVLIEEEQSCNVQIPLGKV